MKKIMDEHLIPAGFEFQKVQKDFKNYMQGKAIYDKKPLTKLKKNLDNNERYELLVGFKEFVLPQIDDVQKLYGGNGVCRAQSQSTELTTARNGFYSSNRIFEYKS